MAVLGERVSAGITEDLEMSLSWIQEDPEHNDRWPYTGQGTHELLPVTTEPLSPRAWYKGNHRADRLWVWFLSRSMVFLKPIRNAECACITWQFAPICC